MGAARRYRSHAFALACLALPTVARSQAPDRGGLDAVATPALRAHFDSLERRVREQRDNAAMLHELGLVGWALAVRARTETFPGTDAQRIGRVADSSLQLAAVLEPKNVRYQFIAGRWLLASNLAPARVGSRRYFDRALVAARALNSPEERAAAALELGRTYWWAFDASEHRHQFLGMSPPRSLMGALSPTARSAAEIDNAVGQQASNDVLLGADARSNFKTPVEFSPAQMAAMLLNVTPLGDASTVQRSSMTDARERLTAMVKPLPADVAGSTDLEKAAALFSEAYAADPEYPGAFRGVAAVWAARGVWSGLERHARAHLALNQRHAQAWLALGLAQHRQGRALDAAKSFESARGVMSPIERSRLDTWQRILPPGFLTLIPERERAAREALYWKTVRPFWSDSTRDPRTEFLARVAYAELRWTVEEFGLGGADSDRGDIYIRYGPPEKMIGLGTDVTEGAGDVVTFWFYPGDMFFAFSGMPTFAVRRMISSDMPIVVDYLSQRPVRWDNIDMPHVDSLPSGAARFRGSADSIDVAIVTEFSDPATIASTMSVSSPVRRNAWLASADGTGERRESGVLSAGGPLLWKARVKPGIHIYRIEAFGETATRGGRATGIIDATRAEYPAEGFGISDLLFARPTEETPGAPRRWHELELSPATNVIARGAPLTMVWENYDFGVSDGRAQYDVTITLKPERSRGAQLRAEILGALARIARIETSNGEVRITIPRDVAHAQAFADWIAVSLPDAPAGVYSLTTMVTDRVSGKEATRSARVVVK